MAAHFGKDKTFVVGNIGTAYTGKALETKEDSVTVAEISSFQLETALTFRPACECNFKYHARPFKSP